MKQDDKDFVVFLFELFRIMFLYGVALFLVLKLCGCNYFPSATHYKCTIIGDPVSSEILVEGAGGASMDGTLKASAK